MEYYKPVPSFDGSYGLWKRSIDPDRASNCKPVPNSRNEPEYPFNIGYVTATSSPKIMKNGQLSITDVKSFAASYVRITGQLKKMHQSKDDELAFECLV